MLMHVLLTTASSTRSTDLSLQNTRTSERVLGSHAAVRRVQVWTPVDEALGETASGAAHQRMAALDTCTCAALVCSSRYGPVTSSGAAYAREAGVLQSRLSAHTACAAPCVVACTLDAGLRDALQRDHRMHCPSVPVLDAQRIEGAAEAIVAAVLQALGYAPAVPSFEAPGTHSTEDSGSASGLPAQEAPMLTDAQVTAWLSAHRPVPAYATVHPAAWSAYDTSAWLETLGSRYRRVADRALALHVRGHALLGLAPADLQALLATECGAQTIPTPAMAQTVASSLRQCLLRCECARVAPAHDALSTPAYCSLGTECRPFCDVRTAVQELCALRDADKSGRLPLDALWSVLRVLGMDEHRAREVAAAAPLENTYFVCYAPLLSHLADAIIRAFPASCLVMTA
jgi:hypothetical protein